MDNPPLRAVVQSLGVLGLSSHSAPADIVRDWLKRARAESRGGWSLHGHQGRLCCPSRSGPWSPIHLPRLAPREDASCGARARGGEAETVGRIVGVLPLPPPANCYSQSATSPGWRRGRTKREWEVSRGGRARCGRVRSRGLLGPCRCRGASRTRPGRGESRRWGRPPPSGPGWSGPSRCRRRR